jgi:hypothetical protein
MRLLAVWLVAAVLAAATLVVGLSLGPRVRGERRQAAREPRLLVESLTDDTVTDPDGAVRSVQTGDVWIPEEELERAWTPDNLERLARTYWYHLGRMSGGALRVMYTPRGRAMALFGTIPLITFYEPEYDLGAERSSVRWRIRRGLLVSQRGKNRDGYLQIAVERRPSHRPGMALMHVEVSIANFYPLIADRISQRLYGLTQSRIHVFAVSGFLRSLARGELAPSKVGRFAQWPMEAQERANSLSRARKRGSSD